MACLFAATHPQRTRSLTLYGAKPRFVRAADYPWGPTADEREEGLKKSEASGFRPDLGSAEWRHWLGSPVRDDPAFLEWFVLDETVSVRAPRTGSPCFA